LSGAMSFSSAKAMARHHASIAGYETMILDLSDVHSVDFTTCRALDDIALDTVSAGREILLAGASDEIYDILVKQEVIDHFRSRNVFKTRHEALLHVQSELKLLKDDDIASAAPGAA